jgi:cyclic pyranopterin phosphate synthase
VHAVAAEDAPPAIHDRRGRALRDLRLSVTDRCNLRCTYCMPRSHYGPGRAFLPHRALLTPAELERLTVAFLRVGARKVRLTGGEPLLRRELCDIVWRLARLGVDDLALTTNGVLLRRIAPRLRRAGLGRMTVSLDTLRPETFARTSDVKAPLADVLDGIDTAARVGFSPIKLNCVVRRGVNDSEVLDLVEYARERRHVLRFIEYMDAGTSNGWRREQVVPAAELVERIAERHPLEPVAPSHAGEVAVRYRYRDGGGEVGVIAAVTRPFCGDCTRARLTADGQLFTCLFATRGTDLAAMVRAGMGEEELVGVLSQVWSVRADRYSELRGRLTVRAPRVEMSYVGG